MFSVVYTLPISKPFISSGLRTPGGREGVPIATDSHARQQTIARESVFRTPAANISQLSDALTLLRRLPAVALIESHPGPVQHRRVGMELRKDPITRSWVVVGQADEVPLPVGPCSLCPATEAGQTLLALPASGPWRVRVTPNPAPLYRIEGEVGRAAEGIYDKMRSVGAHEIVIETPDHDRRLSQLSDQEIDLVFEAYKRRISDLKRDSRFKYATAIKNQGGGAAAEWSHAHSEVIATTFVPRRVLYELRASKAYFTEKERCVFCDILCQEERAGKRVVDTQGDYVAFCPYASRVPYETWIMSRKHNHQFEEPRSDARRKHLAALVGRTLRRLEQISDSYHMVLHTSPNTKNRGELNDYWKTIAEDYHWHIEIMPILPKGSRSYALKEVYFNTVLPEDSAKQLRALEASL